MDTFKTPRARIGPLYMHQLSHFSLVFFARRLFEARRSSPNYLTFARSSSRSRFELISRRHAITSEGSTARRRHRLCGKIKDLYCFFFPSSFCFRNLFRFVMLSGIISGFRWTEEPRCIWPPTVQNSIKAKSDLLCTTFPSLLLLIIPFQFTLIYPCGSYMLLLA